MSEIARLWPTHQPGYVVPCASDRRTGALITALFLMVMPSQVYAQATPARSDRQAWQSLTVTAPIAKGVEVRADGLVVLADDATRVGRELVRVVVLRHLGERVKLGGGYVFTHVAPDSGSVSDEHRIVEEVDASIPLFRQRATLSSRTQLEQRWRPNSAGMSLRLRQQSRLAVPLSKTGPQVLLWNETFVELQATAWTGSSGPSLMLNFAGVELPLNRSLRIAPGYLNQRQFGPRQPRVAHALALFVNLAL
jgi:hypothetical protein